jgi:hypothetical protein
MMPAIGIDWENKTGGAALTAETATATMNLTGYIMRAMTAAYAETPPPPTIMGIV